FCLLAFLGILVSLPAYAQTAVSKEMANAYYNDCAAKADPRFSPDSLSAFCSCTSVQIMEKMSVEEVQTMGQNTQEGRNMLNKMLLDVYAPCMQYPVEDMVAGECLTDKKVETLGWQGDKRALCGCMAAKTGAWFSTAGRDLMTDV